MSIDIDLLKKAWPDGYLAMRGVQTIGGWVCQQNSLHRAEADSMELTETEPHLFFTKNDMTGRYPQVDWAIIEQGGSYCSLVRTPFEQDLLPNVDPSDAATWACILQDLASAIPVTIENGAYWEHWPSDDLWVLGGPNDLRYAFTDILTEDPALAIVLARIQTREKNASNSENHTADRS
jgi:hypothetical protein